jgi:hypothetical protein
MLLDMSMNITTGNLYLVSCFTCILILEYEVLRS